MKQALVYANLLENIFNIVLSGQIYLAINTPIGAKIRRLEEQRMALSRPSFAQSCRRLVSMQQRHTR
jgi:hypothetical protein